MQKLHPRAFWLFFIPALLPAPGFLIALTIIVLSLSSEGELPSFVSGGTLLLLGLVASALYVAGAYLWAKLTCHFYRYELREDGFRKEHGIIWKRYVTIPYDRIQNVDIFRGLIARILGLSDIQVQTAGAITAGSYGAFAEGRLPGVGKEEAERIRDELVRRARASRSGQGL